MTLSYQPTAQGTLLALDHQGPAARDALWTVAPGFYLNQFGHEYFYLTGMFTLMTKHLWDNPLLNTPDFVVDVLDELRQELTDRLATELID